MGEVIRPTMWSYNGYIAFGALRLALGRWLKDTSLFRDAWEIVPERSERYWWSQQIFLGAVAWSVYVGIKGESSYCFIGFSPIYYSKVTEHTTLVGISFDSATGALSTTLP
jgi:hypothetical protein